MQSNTAIVVFFTKNAQEVQVIAKVEWLFALVHMPIDGSIQLPKRD